MTPPRRPAIPGGLGLTARLLLLLPGIALGLRFLGFRRLYLLLLRLSTPRPAALNASPDPQAQARHLAQAVMRVNRNILPYESRCLLESLALMFLLRRAGIEAELFLGVRTIMGPFEAHAWVESDGRVLNDTEGVRGIYEPFDLRCLAMQPSRRGPQTQAT